MNEKEWQWIGARAFWRKPLADVGGIQTGSDVRTPLLQRLVFQGTVLPSCGAWNTSVTVEIVKLDLRQQNKYIYLKDVNIPV